MNYPAQTNKKLIGWYLAERNKTQELCKPLATEDYVIQSIDDVSPPKWHLAHTTWFFETFILIPELTAYKVFDPLYQYLFNSYYQSKGIPYPRIRRGVLSRPTVETIYAYRKYVDRQMADFLMHQAEENLTRITFLVTLGIHHEQQHQELLLMDIKHNFSLNPDFTAYHHKPPKKSCRVKSE